MFGAPKAVHRVWADALIASMILLQPSASNALDSVCIVSRPGNRSTNKWSERWRASVRVAGEKRFMW
jgi:hypothetical protein